MICIGVAVGGAVAVLFIIALIMGGRDDDLFYRSRSKRHW